MRTLKIISGSLVAIAALLWVLITCGPITETIYFDWDEAEIAELDLTGFELAGLSNSEAKTMIPVAMTAGYSQLLFDETAAEPARRTVSRKIWSCGKVGQPPILTELQVRGVFKPLERLFTGETDEEISALTAEVSQATTYISTDGGKTGVTQQPIGNRPAPEHARLLPPSGEHPAADTTPCGYFETDNKLVQSIQRAIDEKIAWTWTTQDGQVLEFTLTPKGSFVYQASADVVEALTTELLAAFRRELGTRPWIEQHLVKTKQEWSPSRRAFQLASFEDSSGGTLNLSAGYILGEMWMSLRPHTPPQVLDASAAE